MTKKAFYNILEQIAVQKPKLAKEIEELALMIKASESDKLNDALIQEYLQF